MVIAATVPAIILLLYICRKDSLQPEPTKWLLKAFLFGIISTFVSLLFSTPLVQLLHLGDSMEFHSVGDAFATAFFAAAIPEELAKLIMLLLLVSRNPYFDDKFDSIVYAVCIGLGFAAFENIGYVMQAAGQSQEWLSVAVCRAFTAIPGHFLFAVIMGYYFSLYRFRIDRRPYTFIMILAAPVLAHGLYDGIVMSSNINEQVSGIVMIIFLLFFNKLRLIGKEHIYRLSK